MHNKLLVGASGLLGTHLKIEAGRPTHQELDITQPITPKKYDLIIDCAGYTKVEQAEIERLKCFDVNVRGTLNLLNAYPTTPFVFISSEYAFAPKNFYGLTKMLAEQLVMTHPNYLIIRTLFKPEPFPHPRAFTDQFTMGDGVSKIAPRIEKAIEEWDFKSKLIYIGTGRKSMYELAKATRPDVLPMSRKEIKTVNIPQDYR